MQRDAISPDLSGREKRILLAKLLSGQGGGQSVAPASFAQRRLWVLQQLEGPNAAYNLPLGLRLKGTLDQTVLRRSLQAIVNRHESLRTRFDVVENEPVQLISCAEEAAINCLDLSAATNPELAAIEAAKSELRTPFDLSTGPLHRATLIRLSSEDHVLLIVIHHIIADAWSIGIFVQELTHCYDAFNNGRQSSLPTPAVQYADFAKWQRESLDGAALSEQLSYWKHKLAGVESLLALPTDHPRPSEQCFEGASKHAAIPDDVAASLDIIAKTSRTTQFTVALSVFKILLYRYSGQADLVVGVPIAGRNQIETEGVIGLFVNTIAIRTDASGNPRFRDYLIQVRDAVLDGLTNQDLPFERLVEELRPVRDLSCHPIFQVMFSSFRLAAQSGRFGSLTVMPYVPPITASRFDLTMYLIQGAAGQWVVQFEYNPRLFDTSRMARMLQHYFVLLRGFTADPDRRISDISILTESEDALFQKWNVTARPYPAKCLHELFDDMARRCPNSTAVIFENTSVTYAELEARASGIARTLMKRGIRQGDLVGVFLERSANIVAVLLGIWKAGAAYVPIDPGYPKERIAYIAEHSGVSTLLTETALKRQVPPGTIGAVELDECFEPAAGGCEPFPRGTPDSLAYVIYTSGSSGQPKGVCIRHRSVVNVLNSMARKPGITPDDGLLAITSLSFDIAVVELLLPLMVGARVIVASRGVASDGAQLMQKVDDSAVTLMQATPTTWRMLIESGWQGNSKLRVWCGGEALPRDLANELTKRSHSVWNLYGPTETAIWSTVGKVPPESGNVPIGYPIDNTRIYVLDAYNQQMPVGVPGELCISGAGLALGYRRDPVLTESRFVLLRTGEAVERIYKTGDWARYLENGELEFLGRYDRQVKLRGFRIELQEVEAALVSHPDVSQAVAMVREDVLGDKHFVAYVVNARGKAIRIPDLLDHLAHKLPVYMLPVLIVLDQFPLTPNGKLDWNALPAIDMVQAASNVNARPKDQLERDLVHMWERLLRVRRIGVRDSFFDLGGHSLLAVRLMAEIKKATGQSLPLSTLFQIPTVEHLAKVLRTSSVVNRFSLVPLQVGGSRPAFFIGGSSPAYHRVAKILGPDQPVYKMDIYALQECRLMTGQAPYLDVTSVAARFVADIKAVQPVGPYFLGGGCDFGITTVEVARQLQANGDDVALLLEWEAPISGAYTQSTISRRVLYKAYQVASALVKGDLLHIARLRFGRLSPEEQRLIEISRLVWTNGLGNSTRERVRGCIHFIVGHEQPPFCDDITVPWAEFAAEGVEVHAVPGDHRSILTSFVSTFADTVGTILAQAQDRARLSHVHATAHRPRAVN